jgi:bacterial/archaeal transporter family-2 protein
MDIVYIALCLIAGTCMPAQAGINSQLRLWTHDPVTAATISFAMGTLVLVGYGFATRVPVPDLRTLSEIPTMLWFGGALGAFVVLVSIIAVPELGAANLMGIMIAGQMISSVVLDHYGWVGYEIHPVSIWRILGVILLVAGVILIKKF